MDWMKTATKWLGRLNPRLVSGVERRMQRLPGVRRRLEREYDALLDELEESAHPYRSEFGRNLRLPAAGRPRAAILAELEALHAREEARWRDGFVSGAVYHGDQAHIDFLNQVYALQSQSNPLHSDLWPSAARFEAEIVAMTGHMLGSAETADEICGAVTSGGTESILLAMKAYRDLAQDKLGIKRPEIVAPVTAHAAFDKAARFFNIKLVRTPVDATFRADVNAMRRAINKNTVALVGSAPAFPHGMIDPIPALADLAYAKGVGLHVDACLGGFILPWARQLGYAAPDFDFRLRGVTSISADTHKYGYAAKGVSVILYRGLELRRYQFYTIADWPGGLYFSPTLAGSRPGALSAACWAAMLSLGAEGYRQAAAQILATAARLKAELVAIPEVRILGDPLWVVAFTSDSLDIYRILDAMTARGWSLNGLHHPPAVHLCVTLRHTQPGVVERFSADLQAAIASVKANPQTGGGMAPVYGLAATLPLKGVIGDMLKRYLDVLYRA